MRHGRLLAATMAAPLALALTAAAPADRDQGQARLRILYPDRITTSIWLDAECAGEDRAGSKRLKVSGGMLRWLSKSKRIGIPATRASEDRPTTNLFTKSVIKEFAIPAGRPVVVQMEWSDLASNGVATYAQTCHPAPLLFTPRPGQDYETGIVWRSGVCTAVIAFVPPDSDATREATPLVGERAAGGDPRLPTVRAVAPCPKA